jgi:hypothetical protein
MTDDSSSDLLMSSAIFDNERQETRGDVAQKTSCAHSQNGKQAHTSITITAAGISVDNRHDKPRPIGQVDIGRKWPK